MNNLINYLIEMKGVSNSLIEETDFCRQYILSRISKIITSSTHTSVEKLNLITQFEEGCSFAR